MAKTSPETIYQYRQILANNPSSQIFVLLAEALRENQQLNEALAIVQNGLKRHPHLVSGHVSHGRILFEMKKFDEAYKELRKVIEISPENILAHQILGEIYVQRKDSKNALASFKKVLFLNPLSERAQKIIAKLESLTASEYEDEVFQMKPLQVVKNQIQQLEDQEELKNPGLTKPSQIDILKKKKVQNIVSICDSFLVRGNDSEALELIEEALKEFGETPELVERMTLIRRRMPAVETGAATAAPAADAGTGEIANPAKSEAVPVAGAPRLSLEQEQLLLMQQVLKNIRAYRQRVLQVSIN